MRIRNLQKTIPIIKRITVGIEVSNVYVEGDVKVNLDGFCYKQNIQDEKTALSDSHVGKFCTITFNGKDRCAFLIKNIGKSVIYECLIGPCHVFKGIVNSGHIKTFDLFSDVLKFLDYKTAGKTYFPNIIMPEVSPVPDDNDTRIVLHNKIESGFAFGRVYRYFSVGDYKTLVNKFTHIEYNDERMIVLIRSINPDLKTVTFEPLRYKDTIFEGNESKFGIFEAEIEDEYFTAYEYYCDAIGDVEDRMRFKLS